MALPPLNLLLPHTYTFRDVFQDYPLLITSPSVSSIVTFLALHRAAELPTGKSLLISCIDVTDSLSRHAGTFLNGRTMRKGKFLEAVNHIDVMQVNTLHELRALLFLIAQKHATLAKGHVGDPSDSSDQGGKEEEEVDHDVETKSVPDSQGTSGDEAEETARPILGIIGMDVMHREAGELSVQGLSRTLASALDAAGRVYHLVIQNSEAIDEELVLMNDASYLPSALANATTTYRKFQSKYISCEWDISASARDGQTEGIWRYLDGGGYRVSWEQDELGQCSNSSIAKLDEVRS